MEKVNKISRDIQGLYTLKDVCEILKIGRTSVYELISQGRLNSTKIHGSRRFTRKHIEDLIKSGEV